MILTITTKIINADFVSVQNAEETQVVPNFIKKK
jgi:hypothetical protein